MTFFAATRALHAAWLRAGALYAGIAVLPLLQGCAPVVQAMGSPVRAAELRPQVAVMTDGEALPLRVWLPEDGPPKAVLVAVHGFNDYSNAFADPARLWATQGIATYTYDQRGFGASSHRGLWPGEATLATDLRTVLRLVRERHPGAPLYVLGESMGAAVAVLALADEAGLADGAALIAPAVRAWDDHNPLARGLLWLAAHTVPWWTASGHGLDIVASDNLPMLRALAADPLVIHQTRADALYGLVELMDSAEAAAPRLTVPVLLLYGAKDELVPPEPVRNLAVQLGPRARLALYPEGYHLLLRDLKAELVVRDLAAWLLEPGAPLPSQADLNGWDAAVATAP